MDTEALWNIAEFVASVLLFAILYYLLARAIRVLAERNVFFTLVEEGTAKCIQKNERFHKALIAYHGNDFAHSASEPKTKDPSVAEVADANPENTDTSEDESSDEKEPEENKDLARWDIVAYDDEKERKRIGKFRFALRTIRRNMPFLNGIKWIGFPPFSEVYVYRFAWVTQAESEEGERLSMNLKFHEKNLDYINVQESVYASRLEDAECADKIPLSAVILITGRIVNPYKALFRISRWLDATVNLIDARMREYFGKTSYEDLISIAKDDNKQDNDKYKLSGFAEIDDFFADVVEYVEGMWGFEITNLRITAVEPASKLAEEFIRATTQKYVAEQEKEANIARGQGLAARDQAHFGAIAGIPNAENLYKWKQIAESDLTTYVEGRSVEPTIPIGEKSGSAKEKTGEES